jgi:hypothetical protein
MAKNVLSMSSFEWDEKKSNAAMLLAQGFLIKEVAKSVKVNEKTIDRWKGDMEFAKEVDRLSLMLDIAGRAERLRIAMRMARRAMKKKTPTRRDLLDWLKFAQGETDGVKLDLTPLLDATTPVAGSGPDGTGDKERNSKS